MDRIVQKLMEAIAHRQEGDYNPFRLSSAGKCARQMAYGLHYPHLLPPVDHNLAARLALGHLIHGYLQAKLSEAYGERFHSVEAPVYLDTGEVQVPGHIDGIVEEEDGPVIVDIKTASRWSAKRMLEGEIPYAYVAQVNAYMEAVGIDRGALLVYVKDTSDLFSVGLERDPEVVEKVKWRFNAVLNSTPESLPPREREKGSWECEGCPFRLMCWGEAG